jgi:hypothetical protein
MYRALVGKPEGKDQRRDPGIDGRILQWIFTKWDVRVWTELTWARIQTGGRHL